MRYKDKNIYLSHRIIDSFPRISKVKILRLKPVLSAARGEGQGWQNWV